MDLESPVSIMSKTSGTPRNHRRALSAQDLPPPTNNNNLINNSTIFNSNNNNINDIDNSNSLANNKNNINRIANNNINTIASFSISTSPITPEQIELSKSAKAIFTNLKNPSATLLMSTAENQDSEDQTPSRLKRLSYCQITTKPTQQQKQKEEKSRRRATLAHIWNSPKPKEISSPTQFSHNVHIACNKETSASQEWKEYMYFLNLLEKGVFSTLQRIVQYGEDISRFVNRTCACEREGEELERWTPLHTVSVHNTENHAAIIKLLYEAGALPNTRTIPLRYEFSGRTALHLACERNCPLIIDALLAHDSIETNSTSCETHSCYDEIEQILNYVCLFDRTPLHICAEKDYADIAQSLIKHRANPNICQIERVFGGAWSERWKESGSTAIQIAIKKNSIATLRVMLQSPLLDLGAMGYERHSYCSKEQPALHLACLLNNIVAGRILVDAGADIFQQNRAGETIFSFGKKKFCQEMIKAKSWSVERIIWMGHLKEDKDCELSKVPSEIIRHVLRFVRKEVLETHGL